MNTLSPTTPLWDRYTALHADVKRLLRMKALVSAPVTKTEFVACMQATGGRTPDGKSWQAPTVNTWCGELRRQGLMTADDACLPALVHPIACDAGESDDAQTLAYAIQSALPAQKQSPFHYRQFQIDGDAVYRLLRLAIYTNDATGFAQRANLASQRFSDFAPARAMTKLFGEVAPSTGWILSRKPTIQAALLEAQLDRAVATGEVDPDLIALCRTRLLQEGFGGLRTSLMRYDLLAGRLDDLRTDLLAIPDTHLDQRRAVEGSVAFLEGRNEDASVLYRDALKLRRKRIGRRKIFLEDEHRVFFVLAMLRANDASFHKEIENGLEAAMAESEAAAYATELLAMLAMLWLVQGFDAKARGLAVRLRATIPKQPFAVACVALAEFFVDPELARGNRKDSAERFEALKDTMPLVARIHAEVLAATAVKPEPYRAWLGPDAGLAFIQIVQTLPPWERALESLDIFLGGGKTETTEAKPARPAKRLVWFLNTDTEEVAVAEQSAKGATAGPTGARWR